MNENINSLDDQFPQEKGLYYLNHAAVSPWPKCTQEAISQFAKENTVAGATYYPKWLGVESELRSLLKTLINAKSSEEIALAKSTSEALSIIAYGLDWQQGDEILISNQEFPSNRIVWESLETQGVKVVTVDIDSGDPVANFAKAINANTRLISVSTVQYASGIAIDCEGIGKLCQQREVLLCLDAIQSLGIIPFDQQKIGADFVVADGHKWMMAAEGLALLYVKQERITELKLNQYGWHMVEHRGNYDLKEWSPANDASRFECGSPNMLGIHALHASLSMLISIGIEHIHDMLQERVAILIEHLKKIEGLKLISPEEREKRAGIVTFHIEGIDHPSLYKTLMNAKIICAHRGGGIRFSPGFYTPISNLTEACKQLDQIVKQLKAG